MAEESVAAQDAASSEMMLAAVAEALAETLWKLSMLTMKNKGLEVNFSWH